MTKTRANYVMVPEGDQQFARFWDAYPKRVAKKDARRAWAKLNPSPAVVDQMLGALAWQTQQPGWLKDGGAYVPYPASWLNAERWTDEPPKPLARAQVGRGAMTVMDTLLGDGTHG